MTRISEIKHIVTELKDQDLLEVEVNSLGGIGGQSTFSVLKNQVWNDNLPALQNIIETDVNRIAGFIFEDLTIQMNQLRDDLTNDINNLKDQIKTDRIGKIGIMGYDGTDNNMLVCEGGIFDQAEYQDLFNKIGHIWNNGVEPEPGKFKVADIRDRVFYGATPTNPVGTYQEDAMRSIVGDISVLMRTDANGTPLTVGGPFTAKEVWNRYNTTTNTNGLWAEVKLGFDNSLVTRVADKNIAANGRVKFGIYYK
ncbi:hypothetical protein ACFX5K_01355 [Rickettsiales bacterium LUAb2]